MITAIIELPNDQPSVRLYAIWYGISVFFLHITDADTYTRSGRGWTEQQK